MSSDSTWIDGQQALRYTLIRPTRGIFDLEIGAVADYLELLLFFVWRDLKVRYKQTALGVIWVLLQPLVSMIIFSVIFGRLVGVPSDGVPYPLFAFAGLVPWNFFATSLNRCSLSLVADSNLISKVFQCPSIVYALGQFMFNCSSKGSGCLVDALPAAARSCATSRNCRWCQGGTGK